MHCKPLHNNRKIFSRLLASPFLGYCTFTVDNNGAHRIVKKGKMI